MKVGVVATMVFAFSIGFPLASMAGLAPDADSDGVPDVLDNCMNRANAGTLFCDTNTDGFGNRCDCDFDNDGDCDTTDFNTFRSAFGVADPAPPNATNSDCDLDVDTTDFNNFRSGFGKTVTDPARKSGLSCAGTVPCS